MDTIEYHKTTTRELLAIKDRVRNLVPHWGEDGRHKEAVLRSVIQKFLPEKYKIGTGFVVRQTTERGTHLSSKQIDLIVYDSSFPALFKDSDFVILTPDSVKAIIEVKVNVMNQGLTNVLRTCHDNGKFINEGKLDKSELIFNGLFSYESNTISVESISNNIGDSWSEIEQFVNSKNYGVNHISFDENWFYKFWDHELEDSNPPHYLYKIEELSFSFFISNLVDWLSGTSVIENSNLWFPVDKSIEVKNRF